MPSWWFQRQTPSEEPTPDEGYDLFFSGDGTEGTTAGTLYRKDASGNVTPVGAGTSYTDEQAQDAVGHILFDTATVDLTYNDAGNTITATVPANAVTNTVLADMAAHTIKGRSLGSAGDPQDLTVPEVKTMLAYAASEIAATPFGTITATNVQTALQALYSLIQGGSGGGGGGSGSITYTNPGTYSLTLPGGVTRIQLIGGGSGGDTLGQPIGGGGGEYAESTLNLTPGNYTVVVGAGGGPNLVGFPSTFNGNLVVANPGTLAGSFGAGTGPGGTGGTGQILFNGGNGGPAATGPTLPGAGGGGAGSSGSGSNGAIGYAATGGGGGPGTPHGGSGGAAGAHGTSGANTGGDGNAPGGGGGGGGAGSSGGAGTAIITWSATDAASGTNFNVAGGNVYFGGAYWNGVENGQPTFFNNASILSDNSDLTYIVGSASKQAGGSPSPGDRYYVQFSVSDIVVFQPDPRVIASFTVTAQCSGPRASTLTVQNLAGPAIGAPMTAHYTSTTFGIQTITAGPFTRPGGGNWAGGDLQNLQLVVALDVDGGYQSGDAGHVPIDSNSPPEINDTRVLKVYKLTVTPSYV